MTPVSPTAVLLYLAAVSTFLLTAEMPTAAAIEVVDGSTITGETYNSPTTFTFNSLIDPSILSSTAKFASCTTTQLITIDGVGLPAPQTYLTSLYMQWKDTTMNEAGGWKLVASLPNAYMHFLNINGNKKTIPFITIQTNFEQNTTVFVENIEVQHPTAIEAVALTKNDNQNTMFIKDHSIVHIRKLTMIDSGYLLKTTASLQITEESQLYMEDCTARPGSHRLFNFAAITIEDHSVLILHHITGIQYLAIIGETTVDETSVLSFIDIDIRGGENLYDNPRSFNGAGTIAWLRIVNDGWSGMGTKEPQNNQNFWVSMKVQGVIQTDAQLSATGSKQNAFNVNTNNKIEWDGTYPGKSECVPVGFAIEGRADYKLAGDTCVATCKKGYLAPACTKAAPPCTIDYCETCARSKKACLTCNTTTRQPSVPNSERCDCVFPFCAICPQITVCTECIAGYKLSDDEKNCFSCALHKCEQCSADDKCKRCATGYKLSKNDGKCYKCTIDNCNYCSSDNVCGECADNHKPANENTHCFHCTMPNCGECSEHDKCGSCSAGYKPSEDDGKCYKCTMDNCNYCSSDNACGQCTAGYKPSADGECFPCTVSACKECSADGKCKACEDNYLPTDGKCYKCAMGNCNYCSSDGVCGQCADGYKPSNDNKNCYQCTMPHCMECSTHNVCKACADGYKLSNADGKCYQCAIANCNYCSSDGVCGECAADHKPTNGNTECFLCSMPQCTECHTDNLCKECAPGFKPSVDEGSCYTCTGDNCANCGTENNCQACDDGYTLTRHKRCVTCNLDNCQRCDASDVCVYCDDKHTVTDSGECVSCDLGNCTSCSSAGTCAMCVCGMVPTEDGKKCVDCAVANCRHCDVSGEGKKCAECIDKYVLTADRTCKAAGLPSWVIFMIVLGISIAIAIGSCLAISFYLRKLARQRQMEADAEERRQNRQAKGRAGRQHLKMAILDLGDIEGAASGVRDDATRQTLF